MRTMLISPLIFRPKCRALQKSLDFYAMNDVNMGSFKLNNVTKMSEL